MTPMFCPLPEFLGRIEVDDALYYGCKKCVPGPTSVGAARIHLRSDVVYQIGSARFRKPKPHTIRAEIACSNALN